MALEIEGKIVRKLGVQSGSSSRGTWSKQEFILEYQEGNFPTKVCMNVWGEDKVKDLETFNIGDRVKASFNLSSREYNGRWYTDVRVWRMEKLGSTGFTQADYAAGAVAGGAGYVGAPAPQPYSHNDYAASAGSYSAPTGTPMGGNDSSDDDLPF